MNDMLSIYSIAFSGLALIVSIGAVIYARRQSMAQQQMANIERDRRDDELASKAAQETVRNTADLSVLLPPPEEGTERTLVVSNKGPHSAADIQVIFNRPNDGRPAPFTDLWTNLSSELAPGKSTEASAGITPESSQDFWVWIDWRDGRGRQRRDENLKA